MARVDPNALSHVVANKSALRSTRSTDEQRADLLPRRQLALRVRGPAAGCHPDGHAGRGRLRLGVLSAARAYADAGHELPDAHGADDLSRHRARGDRERGLAPA